jgi:polysaccharide deacetylase 2 family uncharacterized protein YibQ
VTFAPPARSRPRPGAIALVLAWLVLLGVLAAAAGYVLMAPEQMAEAPGREAAPVPEPELAEAAPAPMAEPEPMPAPTPKPEAVPQAAPQPPPVPAPAAEVAPEPEPKPEPETAAAPEAPAPPPPVAAKPPEPEKAPEPAAKPTPEPEPETAKAPAVPAPKEAQVAALPPPDPQAPWRRNRQPFNEADPRPRIAVVLTGLGLASTVTEAAIKELPAGITLSFTPYSRKLNQWVALARVNGHEVMLDLLMEPTSYPDDDPGPQALLTALSARQNLNRLRWTLDRATGYVGLAGVMGSRFTASKEHMAPVLEELKARGLLFLDNRASDDSLGAALADEIGVPRAVNDRSLDRAQASRVAIDARLVQVENVARTHGFAVAMGRPYPVTIERLREWTEGLEARGFALAPISALANRQTRIAQSQAATE